MVKRMALLLVFLGLSGCAKSPLVSNLLGASSQSATLSSQLFSDDFSKTTSGWDRFQGAIGSTDYHREAYRIQVNEPNSDLFANPGQFFKDVIVEVSAARVGGPSDNNFGLICRYQDEENFYSAQISSDGYAGIFRMKKGVLKLLGYESMFPVPAILGGAGINHIRFDCVGPSLTLIVNNVPVDTREDKSFETGDVGLIAGGSAEGGALVSFDDFLVSRP